MRRHILAFVFRQRLLDRINLKSDAQAISTVCGHFLTPPESGPLARVKPCRFLWAALSEIRLDRSVRIIHRETYDLDPACRVPLSDSFFDPGGELPRRDEYKLDMLTDNRLFERL